MTAEAEYEEAWQRAALEEEVLHRRLAAMERAEEAAEVKVALLHRCLAAGREVAVYRLVPAGYWDWPPRYERVG